MSILSAQPTSHYAGTFSRWGWGGQLLLGEPVAAFVGVARLPVVSQVPDSGTG